MSRSRGYQRAAGVGVQVDTTAYRLIPVHNILWSVLGVQLRDEAEVRKVRKRIAVCATSTAPLRTATELTCHMGSRSITCHPAQVRFPPLPPAN